MSTRKYNYPRELDVSPGLQKVLNRNGIEAHITAAPTGGYQLMVKGHDSPVLTYNLNEKQVQDLVNWANQGTGSVNKKAYNTFVSIVGKDFHLPDNFVSASNAFGKVAMGLHGYRLNDGEYGYRQREPRTPWMALFNRQGRGWGGDFTAWAPRHEGFHLRRMGDRVFSPAGGPVVPVRPDGKIKPGELKSGGYGFYYKGPQQEEKVSVLDNAVKDIRIQQLKPAERPQGQGVRYSDEITSPVYFSNEKFQKVMASHGLVIDENNSTLTVKAAGTRVDLQYDLTKEELQKLTANDISGKNGVTLNERLAVINNILIKDFAAPLTKDMLETKDLVSLDLRPEVRAEVEAPFIEQERRIAEQQRMAEERARIQEEKDRIRRDPNAINGMEIQAILGNKGWFQPVEHGREMFVGEIRVDKTTAGAFVMTAEINGRLLAHTISEKDYNKFLDLDDKHRLKMFDDVFKEVEIKSANGKGIHQDDMYMVHDGKTVMRQEDMDIAHATSNKVDGAALQELNERKGFYRERAHGREVEVRDIQVDPMEEGKYKMTAVINGEAISHEITQKQYDKFLAVDDYHRMQLFSKIFNEVDMKTRPGEGVNIGAAILAAVVATGELVSDMAMGHAPRPEIYESRSERHMPEHVFYKPGVVSPEEVTAAMYHIQEAVPSPDEGMRRGL